MTSRGPAKGLRWLVGLAFLLVFPQAAVARPYVVALPDSEFYPHYNLGPAGPEGILPDVIKAFGRDSGLAFKLKFLPIKRYGLMFAEGEVDFILPDNPQWHHEDSVSGKVLYSETILNSAVGFVLNRHLSDLSSVKRVATIAGYTFSLAELEPMLFQKDAATIWLKTLESVLGFVTAGRADAAYAHFDIVDYRMKQDPELAARIRLAPELAQITYSYHLSTIHHPKVLARFDKWLRSHSQEIEKMYRSYGLYTQTHRNPRLREKPAP